MKWKYHGNESKKAENMREMTSMKEEIIDSGSNEKLSGPKLRKQIPYCWLSREAIQYSEND